MKIPLIVLFLFFLMCSFGQSVNRYIKSTYKYKADIDKKLSTKKLVLEEYPERSLYGGALAGYYFDHKLVLIKTDLNVAFSTTEMSYYVRSDTLLFVSEITIQIKEPDNIEEYLKEHTDKNNHTDFSRLPLNIDENNIYYFQGGKIIDSQMKSFRKKIKMTEAMLMEKHKVILEFYRSHLEELGVSH
jgi:hypothetical protein